MSKHHPVGLYHTRKPAQLTLQLLEAIGMTDEEIKAELKALAPPEWMRRACEARDILRQAGNDTSRERWQREAFFNLATTIETFKGKKFTNGNYLFDVLYQMVDAGYTEVAGIYTTKLDGIRTSLRRVWIADCMRAILRAQLLQAGTT